LAVFEGEIRIMAGEFKGKVAIVTGGAMGIGRASALAFARKGAKVVVADWDIQVDVNLKGIWLCMKYEIPEMLKQGKGTAIVNTSSISGLSGHPADPAYVGSKFGVVGITKSTALQYADKGIRINCVCPGPIRTILYDRVVAAIPGVEAATLERNPMKRIGEAEEVADAVVWLCSDAASYITGVPLPVDGGLAAI
jgi:NAD(P)-dependent dehydrogenase (short-subunit alcohol dehydrogenase family)